MHINYLGYLDYIDIRTLCRTNKQFSKVYLDNTILSAILHNSNDLIILPPNFDIALALDELYNLIKDIIIRQYPNFNYHKRITYNVIYKPDKSYGRLWL